MCPASAVELVSMQFVRTTEAAVAAAAAAFDSQLRILEIEDLDLAEDVDETEDGDKVDNKE